MRARALEALDVECAEEGRVALLAARGEAALERAERSLTAYALKPDLWFTRLSQTSFEPPGIAARAALAAPELAVVFDEAAAALANLTPHRRLEPPRLQKLVDAFEACAAAGDTVIKC
jgi:hypothetical protein